MEKCSNKLEVGQLAMIIGCGRPENTHIIGTIVTIEAVLEKGEKVPDDFINEKWAGFPYFIAAEYGAIVSVINTDHSKIYFKEDFAHYLGKHLMPLPPLEEEEIQKERELELV